MASERLRIVPDHAQLPIPRSTKSSTRISMPQNLEIHPTVPTPKPTAYVQKVEPKPNSYVTTKKSTVQPQKKIRDIDTKRVEHRNEPHIVQDAADENTSALRPVKERGRDKIPVPPPKGGGRHPRFRSSNKPRRTPEDMLLALHQKQVDEDRRFKLRHIAFRDKLAYAEFQAGLRLKQSVDARASPRVLRNLHPFMREIKILQQPTAVNVRPQIYMMNPRIRSKQPTHRQP